MLSRAKMSWLSHNVSVADADKLLTFCILQAKEQSTWLDVGDYGVEALRGASQA